MEIKEVIGIITVILGVAGYLPYIRDVIRGTTRPHVYTWFVWSLITFSIFALQVSGEAGPGAWVTLAVGVLGSLIFILGIQQGEKDIAISDTVFFVLALVALGLWKMAEEPVLAMILLVITGMFGFIPTIRKSWKNPHNETLSTYVINSFRHGLSFLALAQYSVLTWLFPVVWSVANALFAVYLVARRSKLN